MTLGNLSPNPEDRFDRMEREYEERKRAADKLSAVLGLGSESSSEASESSAGATEEKPRDELTGRFVGSADAGEKGAPVRRRPSMGHLIMAHLEDDPSYLEDD